MGQASKHHTWGQAQLWYLSAGAEGTCSHPPCAYMRGDGIQRTQAGWWQGLQGQQPPSEKVESVLWWPVCAGIYAVDILKVLNESCTTIHPNDQISRPRQAAPAQSTTAFHWINHDEASLHQYQQAMIMSSYHPPSVSMWSLGQKRKTSFVVYLH